MQKPQDVLKECGIRVTPQRLSIFKILCKKGSHINVEQLYEAVLEEIPNISLATVYSIVENFRDNGLVNEIKIDCGKSCYEIRTDAHHHFMCKNCKNIFDVDIPLCSTICGKNVDGHKIEDFHGYFYGICKDCASE